MEVAEAQIRVLKLEAADRAKRAAGRDRDLRVLPELEALLRLTRPADESSGPAI